ncbi:MAG: fatty acid desaturase [Rectinemataceae bacterium]|jgi:omega-6 fatty acid desaturase (delta-12 desaturase)
MGKAKTASEWLGLLRPFARPNGRKALIQLIDTLLPYCALIILMYLTIRLDAPMWITLLLGIPAGAFMVRAFILFHDCCHGSFIESSSGLDWIGRLLGFLTFTPYGEWRHSHGLHHTTAGNLDRRGVGDVWTMTVDEYRRSPRLKRLQYRAYRHPIILFVLGPLFYFLIINRLPSRGSKPAQLRSVLLNDLFLAAAVALCWLTIGIRVYLTIILPTLLVAGFTGIWLFYVQHQFDPSYWARSPDWDSVEAAMSGSSYYKLPAILQWISGNIGIHHVHHLLPRIPNYNLRACLAAVPELRLKNPLTIAHSVRSVHLNLWDEAAKRLIAFRELRPRGVILIQ